jgi:type VI secretion system protein ImpJ
MSDLLTGESMERPDTLLKLQATNSVLPVLRQLAGQPEMHPFEVYLQLCRLVGDLAIFGDAWEPPRLVIYEHTDPLKAFSDVKRVVLELLEQAVDTTVERVPFEKTPTAGVWEAEIPEHFLAEGVDILLGVETDLQIEEVAPLFAKGRTVLASPSDLLEVRRRRIEGVPCRRDPRIHPSLRDREGLAFLRIDRDRDFWPSVEQSRKLQLAREAAATELNSFYLYALGIRKGSAR